MHDAQSGAGATGIGCHELWHGATVGGADDSVSDLACGIADLRYNCCEDSSH